MWDSFVDYVCQKLCALFPSRTRTIPRADKPELPLLTQFVIIPERLYLQHFHNPESPEFFHFHRWEYMRSFVLSGHYIEEIWRHRKCNSYYMKLRKRFRTHIMNDHVIHRVQYWSSNCWTLFYMGKVIETNWGYYRRDSGVFTPWHKMIPDVHKIPHVETGKITETHTS